MRLEEKIIMLRKQKGLSQEELAYELEVSRQAVSKWEMGSSTPDLDKIIKMSELFNVSTDYLLKDEEQIIEDANVESIKRVSKKEAEDYINCIKNNGFKVALGVMLCILSPALLIFLSGMADEPNSGMSMKLACGIGVIVMFMLIISAIPLFIFTGMSLSKYKYLKEEKVLLAMDAKKYVTEAKEQFQPTYIRNITIGVVMCIASVIPVMIVSVFNMSDFIITACVALLLAIVASSMLFFVKTGNIQGCFNILLKDNAKFEENKRIENKLSVFSTVFWLTVTAAFLLLSFLTNKWGITWIIWPIAGLVYAAIYIIAQAFIKSKKN